MQLACLSPYMGKYCAGADSVAGRSVSVVLRGKRLSQPESLLEHLQLLFFL